MAEVNLQLIEIWLIFLESSQCMVALNSQPIFEGNGLDVVLTF